MRVWIPKNQSESSEQLAKMFFVVILSCVALSQAQLLQHILPRAQPYDFGYSVRDPHSEQHRQEEGNGHGAVVGNYGFKDARGIARQVNYVADHGGFRAQVNTNEPGTANQNPAAVRVISHQPPVHRVVEPIYVRPIEVVAVPAVHGHGVRYGLEHGDYRVGHDGYGYASDLENSGTLGVYSGGVNFDIALNGGNVRGYDNRFANVMV